VSVLILVDVNGHIFNAAVHQQVHAVHNRLVKPVVEQKAQLGQVLEKLQLVLHLELLSVVNDDKVVIEKKLFDYPINLEHKYVKYAVVCQLQNLIHSNECKYKKFSFS
jgi:septum formation inhibitor-activating ATPase MinD